MRLVSAFGKDWDFPLKQRELGGRDAGMQEGSCCFLWVPENLQNVGSGATCNSEEEGLSAEQPHREPSILVLGSRGRYFGT